MSRYKTFKWLMYVCTILNVFVVVANIIDFNLSQLLLGIALGTSCFVTARMWESKEKY